MTYDLTGAEGFTQLQLDELPEDTQKIVQSAAVAGGPPAPLGMAIKYECYIRTLTAVAVRSMMIDIIPWHLSSVHAIGWGRDGR